MGSKPHAVLAWGFEVENDYSDELFEQYEIDEDGCMFETNKEQGPSYVYVKEFYFHTDWDDLKPIDIKAFIEMLPGKTARDQLAAFCEKHKIPWQEPSWFLAAYEF